MPCFKPLQGFSRPGGGWTATHSQSTGIKLNIPCGQCIGCRTDRKLEWALRLTHESRLHDRSSFVTLTYNEMKVPAGGTLCKRHVQLFIKRLRKSIEPHKIRFFACGEYGDQKGRPHYHLIIFGYWPDDAKFFSTSKGHRLYTAASLEAIWDRGYCKFGDVSPETCKYVSHYTVKKITGPMAKAHYTVLDPVTGELVERQPEFALMSRRPGIGAGLYLKYKSDFRNGDFALLMGRKLPVPRYYDKLLEREDSAQIENIKHKRVLNARKHKANNTPERLAVREVVHRAKLKSSNRKDIAQ